jgi:hypothetical protein
MHARYHILLTCLGLLPWSVLRSAEPVPEEIFRQRLLPIFKSPNPSSCVQCHLAGVDLKDYLLDDHEKTFRSLRDQGLIDVKEPEKSKILRLIQMGSEDKKGAELIHAKTRRLEYEAFSAWIKASVADPKLRDSPKLAPEERAKLGTPVAVIRHARKDRLLESFEQNVWAWRFRCMNCHTEGTPQNVKLRQEFGERVSWVKKDAPSTMDYLLGSKLVDAKKPEASLLLLKPLGVKPHEGGVKFLVGDQAYKGFRLWIEDLASIRGDRYTKAEDLPTKTDEPARFGSDIWLKVTDLPENLGDKLLQVRVFAWDARKKAWETEPIATSDRAVATKARLWQHNLTLLALENSERFGAWKKGKPSLSGGNYLAKLYADREGKLKDDWKQELGEEDFVGQVEFRAEWKEGYGGMSSADGKKIKK